MRALFNRIDPMVRLILIAIVLATLMPVTGGMRAVAQFVSNAAVFTLFLLYGLRLARGEVLAGLGNRRVLLALAIWVFGAMTFAGWLLWQAGMGWLPPLLALGFLYLGLLPSTIQAAPAYSSLAGGNVAISVVAAAMLNILGVFICAPLFSLLAGSHGTGFHGATLVKVITMLLLPFIAGQLFQRWAGDWVRARKPLVAGLERTAIGIAVYVAFSGAVEQGLWTKVELRDWALLAGGVALLLAAGYGGAWLLGGVLRLERPDRISLLFAGAQKSAAMGAPLATVIFPPAVAGVIILPLLVYHLAQMVVAAPIAGRLGEN